MKAVAFGVIWLAVMIQSSWGHTFGVMPDLPWVAAMIFVFQILRRLTFDKQENWIDILLVLAFTGFLSGVYSMTPVETYMGLYFAACIFLFVWQKGPWAKFRESDTIFVVVAGILCQILAAAGNMAVSAVLFKRITVTALASGAVFFLLRLFVFERKTKKELRFMR